MNRLYRNSISLSIAFAFAFIAANSVGYLYYISKRMIAADATYSTYLGRDATAATMAERLGRTVYQMSYVAFRALGEADPDESDRIGAAFEPLPVEAGKLIDGVRRNAPAGFHDLLLATLPVSRLRWLALPPVLLGLGLMMQPERHDLYVDRQGWGAAVRGPDGRLAILGNPSGFVLEQWLKADGDGRRLDRSSGAAPGGRCDRLGCTALLPDGRAVALVRDRRAFPEDCARAAVLITSLTAPPTCTGPLVIDRRVLATHGAVALRADGNGFILRTAHGDDRSTPWRPKPAQTSLEPAADSPIGAAGGMALSETSQAPAADVAIDAPAEPLQ